MNLRDLAYLVAVADHRHFGRAADASSVSQPTLSGQIRKLEEELGVVLFERDSRNVVPTAAGEAIAAEARAALSHADAIRDLARAHRDPLSGRFRLGVIATLGPFLVPDLLAGLGVGAPRMEVFCVENLTGPLLARLRARELDAALLATEPDGDDLTETVLFDEPFLIAHAPGHPLAARRSVGLADIEDGTLLLLSEGHCLRDQALSVCGTAAVDMRLQAASLMTLLRLVAQGHGTTLVPALASRWTGKLILAGARRRGAGPAGAAGGAAELRTPGCSCPGRRGRPGDRPRRQPGDLRCAGGQIGGGRQCSTTGGRHVYPMKRPQCRRRLPARPAGG